MTTDKHTFNYRLVINIIKPLKLIEVLVILKNKMKSQVVLVNPFHFSI